MIAPRIFGVFAAIDLGILGSRTVFTCLYSEQRSDKPLSIHEAFAHLTRRTLDILIPPRCSGCTMRETWLCQDCRSRMARLAQPLCAVCSRPSVQTLVCGDCYRHPPPYDVLRAPWSHNGLARELVHSLKFQGQRHLAEVLADEMCLFVDSGIELVIPVPLHRERLKERGYNQSELLGQEIATRLKCPLENKILIRTRATLPQTGLDRDDRHVNVRGAFGIARRMNLDRHVLLVDDVSTTGATIAACARTLREHGAKRISAVVATRAIDAIFA